MQNLVQNQHGTYTFRRRFGKQSVRVSLKTSNEVEAKRIYFKLQDLFLSHPFLTSDEARHLIKTLLAEMQGRAETESRRRLLALLNTQLNPAQSILLGELFTKYKAEKVRSNSWSMNTEALAEDQFALLINLIGDLPISEVDKSTALVVKEAIQKLPSHANKKRQYRDKSLQELRRMKIPPQDLMSVKTINMKLSFYSETFNWSVVNGLTDSNPFKGVQIKDKRNAQSLRQPFSISDLNEIFSAPQVTNASSPHRFWLPVLALYTGCRINELCQLYVDDIRLVTEIWCIEISDKRQDQSLKTESSRRTIPIHEDLVELGFLSFVDGLRVGKHERLFQELASGGKKYSREASKWFSRIKPKILPDADSKKCFHSFRHCFTDNLVNSNNWGADPAVKVLLGHQNKDITTGLYGAGTSIQRLKGVVDTLSWKALGVVIKRQG